MPNLDKSPDRKREVARLAKSERVLTHNMWSVIVETWNRLHIRDKHARVARCKQIGHDIVQCPVSLSFCRRCCAYFD